MERWHNKVAVITGASSGIGEACCRYLLARGMIVVGLARRLERMEVELKAPLSAEEQTRFHPLRCDVSKEQEIIEAFAWIEEKLGGTDVLINNAGIMRNTLITAEHNTDDLRAIIDTNLLGVAYCTREAVRSMRQRSFDGHIVHMNSISGHTVPNLPGRSLNMYPPSKHALTAMTEVMRQEFLLQGTRIKVTSISPGATHTEIGGNKSVPPNFPMLRSEDVADAVVYCLQTPPGVQIHELIMKPMRV